MFHYEYIYIPNSPSRPYTGGKDVLQSTTEKRHVSGSTAPNNCLHFHSVCCYWCWADWQKWQSRLKGCVNRKFIVALKNTCFYFQLIRFRRKQNWIHFNSSEAITNIGYNDGDRGCTCVRAYQFQVSFKKFQFYSIDISNVPAHDIHSICSYKKHI